MATQMIPAGRSLVALGWLIGWAGLAFPMSDDVEIKAPYGLTAWLDLNFLLGMGPVVGVSLLGMLLCVTFVKMKRPIAPAFMLFSIFFVYARIEETLDPGLESVTHGKFLPGMVVFVYAAGLLFCRDDDDGGERRAMEAACGIVAALYVWAGLIKMWVGGPSWAWDSNLALLVLERSFLADGLLSAIRAFFGHHPMFMGLLGTVAILVEVAGLAFLVPMLRWRFAAVVTVMHWSIGLLMHYFYIEWQCVIWGLVLWTWGLEKQARGEARYIQR